MKDKSDITIELYNDDCFKVMDELINKGVMVDHIICDPPYNINIAEWDKDFDFTKAADRCLRLLKPTGNLILFSGWSEVCSVINIFNKYFLLKNWIIWDRIKGRGATKNLMSTREDILWYSNNSEPIFHKRYSNIKKATAGMGNKNGEENRSLSNVWYDISPIVPWGEEKTEHPSQKPVELMERCIDIWSNEGDTILDFTMGSGSTGVACRNLFRNFIGIEKDKEWFKVASSRINNLHKVEKVDEDDIITDYNF